MYKRQLYDCLRDWAADGHRRALVLDGLGDLERADAPGAALILSLIHIWVSLKVGVIATVVATALGTLIALAMVRYRFKGKASGNFLIFLPMATPEIVMGASLLTIFVQGFGGIFELGFWTIVIAHIMFCLSLSLIHI